MEKNQFLKLHIVSGDGEIFQGEVDSLNLNTSSGYITILPNHAPLISSLDKGVISVRTKEGEKQFKAESGVLDISHDKTVVLIHKQFSDEEQV
ncbi:ATP synthase F1 subunit epsilon [Candidatus Nomurabacteria bacterium]|nr:ATP synthase F1 subunit epsilon [Candidatus Nomurabacteria bacterium]